MKVLLIDNYDSFTHNLAQQIWSRDVMLEVYRNDHITVEDIIHGGFTHIIISPGPGHPDRSRDFGVCAELLKKLPISQPLLGVCLGHQGIASHFGAEVQYAPHVMHGKTSFIQHLGEGLFKGLSRPLKVMRYHSLCISTSTLPKCLVPTAWCPYDGVLMGIQHTEWPVYGVQFHPESVGTPQGDLLMNNFLEVNPLNI